MTKTIIQVYGSLPKPHKIMLSTLTVMTLAIIIWHPIITQQYDKNKNISEESPINRDIIIRKDNSEKDINQIDNSDTDNVITDN
ncbi:MAG: OapA N-terminal domain-containing protein, partial [Arsenophonus sp. ET-DL12-MAG3]